MQVVDVWVDGSACWKGAGCGIVYSTEVFYAERSEEIRTNNEAEALAVYWAVMTAPVECELRVYTDSKLMVGWLMKGWRINNPCIAQIIDQTRFVAENKGIVLRVLKVKGHADDPLNELAHRLAYSASHSLLGGDKCGVPGLPPGSYPDDMSLVAPLLRELR